MKSLLHILSLGLLVLSINTSAQTVAGKWYGVGNADMEGGSNNYLVELILVQRGSNITGEFNYYFKDAYFPNKISGNYDSRSRRLTIKTTPITYFRSATVNGVECGMNGEFTFLIAKTGSSLKGRFTSTSFYSLTCPDIFMNLSPAREEETFEEFIEEKSEEDEQQHESSPEKVQELQPGTPIALPVVHKEKSITEKEFERRKKEDAGFIELDSTNITIMVVDNGEIDKDSVTLFFNNTILADKIELTKRGLVFNVSLDTTRINEISMFAENLGLIPPNTALLMIYDGKKRHEINLTSTLKTNGTVRLRKKGSTVEGQ